ncbi:MAG: hypothetical protein GYA23_06690 [Methanomicrobiales archaeon]|nr:hypothetical protein [Methanomicrobiales archaeon]
MRKMELDSLILRWKKTTRALKIHEQGYGRHLTDILERLTDAQLVYFQDPVEAAAFFCLLDTRKKLDEIRICSPAEPGRSLPKTNTETVSETLNRDECPAWFA